jgi:protein tyrosine phosphatase (PTP) superfamily phosphohydrolase (DUF442 family)
MEISEDEVQYLINIIDQAQQDLHSEFCYSGHCSCSKFYKAIEMLQKIQRTTADMRLANARSN